MAVSNNYVIDSERPSATVVVANPNLGVGQTSLVTITFNEAVSHFDLSDISAGNGTLSNLSSNDGGKTWTATLTPSANVSNGNNAITLNKAAVSDAAGNTGSGVIQSNGYAINTVPAGVVPTSPVVVFPPDPAGPGTCDGDRAGSTETCRCSPLSSPHRLAISPHH